MWSRELDTHMINEAVPAPASGPPQRDMTAHHRATSPNPRPCKIPGPRTRAELEKSLERIEPLMLSSLTGCAFLAHTRWVHTDRLQWVSDDGTFRVSGLALMGDHPDFATVAFDTARPLADDRLYLITPHDAPLSHSPYCLLSDCPACLAPELYYPDRLTSSTALLKSLDRGHELDSDSVFKALREWGTP